MPCFSIRSRLVQEESEVRMEGAICQGWLIKSPPEKKMPGPRRIFPSRQLKCWSKKWRRRYFVLGDMPASVSLPGSCGRLEYYESAKCTKRKGSIDLDQCESVTISLGLYDHPYLFALVSKHKGRNRTYFLAADSEDTMNRWVECLCKVCGFKPTDETTDDAFPEQWPTQQAPTPDRYTPEVSRTQEPAAVQQMPDIVPVRSEPERLVGSSNIPSRVSKPPSNNAASSILHVVPPAPRTARVGSTDSIPDELAPEPPDKGIPRRSSPSQLSHDASTYDQPRNYVNIPPTKQEPYKGSLSRNHDSVPAQRNAESVYQIPPHPAPVSQGLNPRLHNNNSMFTSVPPAQSLPRPNSKRDSNSSSGSRGSTKQDSAYSSEDTYDPVPPPRKVSTGEVERLTQNLRTSTLPSGGGRPSMAKVHTPQKAQSVNNLINNQVPPPPHSSSYVQPPYINIPTNSKSHPSYANLDLQRRVSHQTPDSTYDIPPQWGVREDPLAISPPPPPHNLAPVHAYVNDPTYMSETTVPPPPHSSLITDDTYLPMDHQSTYLPMSQSTSFQDRFVPIQPGDRSGNSSYFNMDGQASNQDDMYLPMERQMERQMSDTYAPMDRPSSDTYMPVGHNSGQHGTYDESYVSMVPGDRESTGSVYTDMSQAPPPPVPPPLAKASIYEVPPSNKPVPYVPPRNVEPPRLQPQNTGSNQDGGAFVYKTPRTKSFKREVPRPGQQDDPLLPMKRTGVSTSEMSSSDDDDESSSSLDQSSDAIPAHKPSKVEELRGKKSLNSTPPPPKRPGEVQYLDLALENDSSSERSPVFPRSPPPPACRHGNASPTEYKEIDFVKTKALTEVKREMENKRKSSDKSIDE